MSSASRISDRPSTSPAFDLATLREAVEAGEAEGRAEILDALDAVYPRFVLNVGRFNPAHGLRS